MKISFENKAIIFYRTKLAMTDLIVNHRWKDWHEKTSLHLHNTNDNYESRVRSSHFGFLMQLQHIKNSSSIWSYR